MPWQEKDVTKHTKDPSVNKARWTAISNAILKRTGDEGQAIRVANSKAKK